MGQGKDSWAAEDRGATVHGEFFGQRGKRGRCSEVQSAFSAQQNLTGDKHCHRDHAVTGVTAWTSFGPGFIQMGKVQVFPFRWMCPL